jgi:hypothetical protein
MTVEWEQGEGNVVAYRVYTTQLPMMVKKAKPKATKAKKSVAAAGQMSLDLAPTKEEEEKKLTEEQKAAQAEEGLKVDGTFEYTMRLPFSLNALVNRYENGRDVPEWALKGVLAELDRRDRVALGKVIPAPSEPVLEEIC